MTSRSRKATDQKGIGNYQIMVEPEVSLGETLTMHVDAGGTITHAYPIEKAAGAPYTEKVASPTFVELTAECDQDVGKQIQLFLRQPGTIVPRRYHGIVSRGSKGSVVFVGCSTSVTPAFGTDVLAVVVDTQGSPITEHSMRPDILAVIRQWIGSVRQLGSPQILEHVIVTSEGPEYIEIAIVPIESGAVCTVRDVTGLRESETKLRGLSLVKQALATRIIQAQELERQNLARELHDAVGQMLLVHRMDAEWIRGRAESETIRRSADKLSAGLDDTLQMVRTLARGLRPPSLDDLGLDSALEQLSKELIERAHIHCEVDVATEKKASLCGDAAVALYRVAQEACSNAIRHGKATSLQIILNYSDSSVQLRVVDNGVGIQTMDIESTTSVGLLSMRERTDAFGGTFAIQKLGTGTSVFASIPADAFVSKEKYK